MSYFVSTANKDWLENKSFHTSAAILVQNNSKKEIDKSLSGTNSFDQGESGWQSCRY